MLQRSHRSRPGQAGRPCASMHPWPCCVVPLCRPLAPGPPHLVPHPPQGRRHVKPHAPCHAGGGGGQLLARPQVAAGWMGGAEMHHELVLHLQYHDGR